MTSTGTPRALRGALVDRFAWLGDRTDPATEPRGLPPERGHGWNR